MEDKIQANQHATTSSDLNDCSEEQKMEIGVEETDAASSEASSPIGKKHSLDPPAPKASYPSFISGSFSDRNHFSRFIPNSSSKSLSTDSKSLDLNAMLRRTSDHQMKSNCTMTSRTVSKVSFRSLLTTTKQEEHVTVMDFEHSEDNVGDDQQRELPTDSKIFLAGQDSTFPIVYDNQRFFSTNDGYGNVLNDAVLTMEELVQSNDLWDEANKETGVLETVWHWCLRVLMCRTGDTINRLNLSRGLQELLFFQSAYESFVLSSLIRELDATKRPDVDSFALLLAFRNRNVSRILVGQLMTRWDWMWHLHTQISYSRWFDFFGRFPFMNFLAFPSTENFIPLKTSFIGAGLGLYFGIISWLTRLFRLRHSTSNAVKNLSQDNNDLEEEFRYVYGTYCGREAMKTFRLEHRLSIDESIIWKFMKSPALTIINNGVEHVLWCLANHWKNMVFQENGNFSHNKLELLHPFQILRYHIPIVLSTLANLRGRTRWDSEVLAPCIAHLQQLDPSRVKKRGGDVEIGRDSEIRAPCIAAQAIIEDLKTNIVPFVCAGIRARIEPFQKWLTSIGVAFDILSNEAQSVRDFVACVEVGVSIGYQLLKLVSWRVPGDNHLAAAILAHFMGQNEYSENIPSCTILTALKKLDTEDLSTLKYLLLHNHRNTKVAGMLLFRAKKLLSRELRRTALDRTIRSLSKGQSVTIDELVEGHWYLLSNNAEPSVVMFCSKDHQKRVLKFIQVETHQPLVCKIDNSPSLWDYIPIAEAIARAQKAFVTIEVEFCKRFSYSAFMEFGYAYTGNSLRNSLRRLATVSEIHCSELDKGRLNVLVEMRNSIKFIRKGKPSTSGLVQCKPQNTIIIGTSPTGCMFALHCLQNIIFSGGKLKIYENQHPCEEEVFPSEKSHITCLDARWVAMLRYHLGTSFEDAFVHLGDETDAFFGNVLPTEGFVELASRKLGDMLFSEVNQLSSRNLLNCFSGLGILLNVEHGLVEKKGSCIEIDDVLFDHVENMVLHVKDFTYSSKRLPKKDLKKGDKYIVVPPGARTGIPFRLVQINHDLEWFKFIPFDTGTSEITGSYDELPSIFKYVDPPSCEPVSVVVEVNGTRANLDYESIAKKTYCLDVSACNVIIALGAPVQMASYFRMTTEEPYAACSVEGLKISMGMHLFGGPRFGNSLNDARTSTACKNSRGTSYCEKGIRVKAVAEKILVKIESDPAWKNEVLQLSGLQMQSYFEALVKEMESFSRKILHRQRLQARWLEAGSSCYLGMELPREFLDWKNHFSDLLSENGDISEFSGGGSITTKTNKLNAFFDSIWLEASMDLINESEISYVRGKPFFPRFYTVNGSDRLQLGNLRHYDAFSLWKGNAYCVIEQDKSLHQTTIKATNEYLGVEQIFAVPSSMVVLRTRNQCKSAVCSLECGEEFEPLGTFELIEKMKHNSVARVSAGDALSMQNTISVNRQSDLARGHWDFPEPKIALSCFNVAHHLHHRTWNINKSFERNDGSSYITAFVGTAQASPHVMRLHGLTGGGINCVSFNNLLAQALRGTKFEDRIQRYTFETTWSNGEIVREGTGRYYGEDGSLRPGFTYQSLIDFLFDRASEYCEMEVEPTNSLLTIDWKAKLAAALVPRGLETDLLFYNSLFGQMEECIYNKFMSELDKAFRDEKLTESDKISIESAASQELLKLTKHWRNHSTSSPNLDNQLEEKYRNLVQETSSKMNIAVEALLSTLRFSIELRLKNHRTSSELSKQLQPLERVVHDDGKGAQSLVHSTVWSIALVSLSVALCLPSNLVASAASFLVSLWNASDSLRIMIEASRHRNRNAELQNRIIQMELSKAMKTIFSLMNSNQRFHFDLKDNPFLANVDILIDKFLRDCRYYQADFESINSFKLMYNSFKNSSMTQANILEFMREIIQRYISSNFHDNSYLQEDLVKVCEEFDDIIFFSRKAPAKNIDKADELFRLILKFQQVVKDCRGETKLLGHWTLTRQAKRLFKTAQAILADNEDAEGISYVLEDFREIYYAGREIDFSSIVIISAAIFHCFSLTFGAFQLVSCLEPREDDPGWQWVKIGVRILSWVPLSCAIFAAVTFCILARRLSYLHCLRSQLHVRSGNYVSAMVTIATMLTILRLIGLTAAFVALQLSATFLNFESENSDVLKFQLFIAACSVMSLILASSISCLADFIAQYNSGPCFNKDISRDFAEQIQAEKRLFPVPPHADLNSFKNLDKIATEYAARQFLYKYRLDLIFPADRVSAIFHYLQSDDA